MQKLWVVNEACRQISEWDTLNHIAINVSARQFKQQDFVDEVSAAITKHRISANKLGLNVIAEGVETKEQAQFLKQKGCNNYQGYYYGRPMPAEDLFKELKK